MQHTDKETDTLLMSELEPDNIQYSIEALLEMNEFEKLPNYMQIKVKERLVESRNSNVIL